jgi:hypothetical protein
VRKEMTEEEERKFWDSDNYDDYMKELEFYRATFGNIYRVLKEKKEKVELEESERLSVPNFFDETPKIKRRKVKK